MARMGMLYFLRSPEVRRKFSALEGETDHAAGLTAAQEEQRRSRAKTEPPWEGSPQLRKKAGWLC